MPQVIGAVGLLLSIAFLVRELRRRRDVVAPGNLPAVLRNILVAFAWLVLFVVLVYLGGTMLAAAVFVPVFLLVVARWTPWKVGVYTVLLLGLLWTLHLYAEIALPIGLFTPQALR
jgi:hypothetical protein